MGQSSSQPTPKPRRPTSTPASPSLVAEHVPHLEYYPTMDDLAASQQLTEEEARTERATGDTGGKSKTKVNRITGGRRSDLVHREEQVKSAPRGSTARSTPIKQPSVQSFGLDELQAHVDSPEASQDFCISLLQSVASTDPTPPHREVVVPDSQVEPHAPTPSNAPMTPPMTSSIAIPASMPEKKTHKKSKKRIRAEVDPSNIVREQVAVDDNGSAVQGAFETVAPLPLRSSRKRRQLYAEPGLAQAVFSSPKQDADALSREVEVAAGPHEAAKPTKISRKKRSLTRKSAVLDPVEDDEVADGRSKRVDKKQQQLKIAKPCSTDDEIIDGRSQRVDRKIKRLKKATLRPGAPPTSQDISETPSLSMDPDLISDDNVNDTPLTMEDTPAMMEDPPPPMEDLPPAMDDTPPRTDHLPINEHTLPTKRSTPNGKLNKALIMSRKSANRGNNNKKVDDEMYDWPAPVRNVDQPPDTAVQDTSSNEGEIPHISPPKNKTRTKKSRKKRESKTLRTSEPHRRYSRKSNVDSSITAADRALNTVRQLHHPPDTRSGGAFTEDEDELIRRAIQDYQQRKNLDTYELVDIIQWTNDSNDSTMPRPLNGWSQQEMHAKEESDEFWEELRQINLKRKHNRVKNHVRSRYHAFKTGVWTEEEDEQLQGLVELHPRRWKLISQIVGDRSPIDIHNRWKDYLQHGDNRNTSRWTEEEESLLSQVVATVVQRDRDHRAEIGEPPVLVYTKAEINWPRVSIEMGNIRSRLQCSVKWSRMMKKQPQALKNDNYAASQTDVDAPASTRKPHQPRKSQATAVPENSNEATPATEKSRSKRKSDVADTRDKIPKPAKRQRRSRESAASDFPIMEHDRKSGILVKKSGRSRESAEAANPGPDDDDRQDITEPEEALQHDVDTPTFRFIEHEMQAGKVVSKGSRRRESNKAGPDSFLKEDDKQEVPSTPGVDKMRWGDKFDLVEQVASRDPQNEEDVDWHAVAAAMKQSWSLRTLQTALKELLDLVMDQGTLSDTANEVMIYLSQHHSAEELKDYYDLYEDMDFDDGTQLTDPEEDRSEANLPNTKRKRKIGASGNAPGSRTTSKKRTKMGSVPTTPKAFKSTELITESDDE